MSIIAEIADEGFRITKLRSAIIEIMAQSEKPFSIDEIARHLRNADTPTHRWSLYRQMELLVKMNVAEPVIFHDGLIRYELLTKAHHHHVICTKCDHVEDVALKTELDEEEKRIERKTKFQITRHSLEFFGLCASCRS